MTHPYREQEDRPDTPREQLVGSIEFALRVASHSDRLTVDDTTKLARNIVEKLDAYLASIRDTEDGSRESGIS